MALIDHFFIFIFTFFFLKNHASRIFIILAGLEVRRRWRGRWNFCLASDRIVDRWSSSGGTFQGRVSLAAIAANARTTTTSSSPRPLTPDTELSYDSDSRVSTIEQPGDELFSVGAPRFSFLWSQFYLLYFFCGERITLRLEYNRSGGLTSGVSSSSPKIRWVSASGR